MSCTSLSELQKRIDGDVSVARSQAMDEHIGSCADCSALLEQLETMRSAIAVKPQEFQEQPFVSKVLERANKAEPLRVGWFQALWWRQALSGLAVAAAAAGVAAFFIVGEAPQDDGFQARDGAVSSGDHWVSFEVYQERDKPGHMHPVGRVLSDEKPIGFSVDNRSEEFRYLMLFGVDAAKTVYWFHPAYTDEASDPQSLDIPAVSRHTLREEVMHELPKGSFRIFGIFSARPQAVSMIEEMIASDSRELSRMDRIPLPDVGQQSRMFEVE